MFQADMDKVIEEYMTSTDEGLVSFAQNIIDGNLQNPSVQNYSIGKVADQAVTDIKQIIGVDVTDFSHNIKGNHVEHIDYRHGENGKADKSMADLTDYGRLKYVLDNYDSIELSPKKNTEFKGTDGKPSPMVVYKKRINGQFHIVEAVPDANAKEMQIVSVYKSKAEK